MLKALKNVWDNIKDVLVGKKIHILGGRIDWPEPPTLCYPGKLTKEHFDAKCSIPGVFEFDPGPGGNLSVGEHQLIATFLPEDPEYPVLHKVHHITVERAYPHVTWKVPIQINEGTPLSRKQLNAACINLPGGEYIYNPAQKSKLTIGTHVLSCEYIPEHEYSKNYCPVLLKVEIKVVPMIQPKMIWGPIFPPLEYGTPLGPDNILNAVCPGFIGRIEYDPPKDTVLQAGLKQLVKATFIPENRNEFKTAVMELFVDVQRATPVVLWPSPSSVYAGTELSEDFLRASNDLTPSTHAIYNYVPPAGTILEAGEQELRVEFTPDPNLSSNYCKTTLSVPFTVMPKKIPIIEWSECNSVDTPIEWRNLPPIQYGQELSRGNVLTAVCTHFLERGERTTDLTFAGIITYEPSYGTILSSAEDESAEKGESKDKGEEVKGRYHTVTATFTPYNEVEFEEVSIKMRLQVKRCTLDLIWPQPVPMLKNFGLSETQQNAELRYPVGTSSRVRTHCKAQDLGELTYDPPPDTIFHAGEELLTVKFTPHAKWNKLFTPRTQETWLEVIRPEPLIVWPELDTIYLGHELSEKQLNANCTEIEGGKYTYEPPHGTILKLGVHTLQLKYECEEQYRHDYGDVVLTRSLTVMVAKSPTVSWQPPKPIPYNTPLTLFQLNATCNVRAGFFLYDPPRGAILEAGETHVLKVTWTPNDRLEWLPIVREVPMRVFKADPVLVWEAPTEFYAGMSLQNIHLGCYPKDLALANGTTKYSPAAGAVLPAGIHTLTCTFAVDKPWRKRYNDVRKRIELIVLPKVLPDVVWENSSKYLDWDEITYGVRLGKRQLNALCEVEGTIEYSPPAHTLLQAGDSHTISVTFTPKNRDKYLINTITRTLCVNKATPIIVWEPKPLPFLYVGKPITRKTLNAFTTSQDPADDRLVEGNLIYCPELHAPDSGCGGEGGGCDGCTKLAVDRHTFTVIFQPTEGFEKNYTFSSKFIYFSVIEIGSLFKLPKRYTDPEPRPEYREDREYLNRPLEAINGDGKRDFYHSEVDTVALSDRTRMLIEKKETAAEERANMHLENRAQDQLSRPNTRS